MAVFGQVMLASSRPNEFIREGLLILPAWGPLTLLTPFAETQLRSMTCLTLVTEIRLRRLL